MVGGESASTNMGWIKFVYQRSPTKYSTMQYTGYRCSSNDRTPQHLKEGKGAYSGLGQT
jgi:hypothetical protein